MDLVRRLLREQMPQWAELPVVAVDQQGHDNRTFRLGDHLTVRLPSHQRYAAGIAEEEAVLPLLGRHLRTSIPEVVATGRPSEAFGIPFAVRRWLPGTSLDAATAANIAIDERLAADVGGFLRQLRAAPTEGGPAGGKHSFFRGCHPSAYGHEVQLALQRLAGAVDVAGCERVWARAIATAWPHPPVWFHGDVAPGNLLIDDDGALTAVIDFGTCGVGDPACDLVLMWTHVDGNAQQHFREAAGLDDDTWARARGWALWKALITLAELRWLDEQPSRAQPEAQLRIIDRVLADAAAAPRRWSSGSGSASS
ncbi:Predicted kinase, aminoglycoside phosphotransferase (APT) family [Quadrisphaera granulorum]|uniref:Aminoglycoside phosphotransferase (APT) family kinase protein n=1 Tax=Quadrisphaera granulorum TaxID=317664 RepID=A0A315ZP77_9ACTN|nr:aminoglycoside phosphotransferase (APT) family kinase protein [Quadrisphaera granulorum]SZE98916.1 Predicted kinase, aminoglycoside phosphotransferase (APT) family [Quadrisphaera granulorum]